MMPSTTDKYTISTAKEDTDMTVIVELAAISYFDDLMKHIIEQEMIYHDDDNNDILRIINLIQESTPLVSYDFLCLTKLVD
jgi:hypothetical protein